MQNHGLHYDLLLYTGILFILLFLVFLSSLFISLVLPSPPANSPLLSFILMTQFIFIFVFQIVQCHRCILCPLCFGNLGKTNLIGGTTYLSYPTLDYPISNSSLRGFPFRNSARTLGLCESAQVAILHFTLPSLMCWECS